MNKFVYKQLDWKAILLPIVFIAFLFQLLNSYVGITTAALIVIGINVLIFLILSDYFLFVVAYKDAYLQYKKSFSTKYDKLNYSEIDKMTFTHDRFLDFHIYTNNEKIKLPSPTRLKKAEELFQWLNTNHPNIATEVIYKKASPASLQNR